MLHKTQPRRIILGMMLLALFVSFSASTAHAGKVPKIRGLIVSVDETAMTLTIDHQKKGKMTLKYTAETKFKGTSPSELKPGMFVITWLTEKGSDTFISLRRVPESDKKPEESEESESTKVEE